MDLRNTTTSQLFAAADLFQICGIALDFPNEHLAEGLHDGSLAQDAKSCLDEMGCGESTDSSVSSIIAATAETSVEETLSRLRIEHSRLFANTSRPVIWIYETMFCHIDDGRSEKPSLFVSPACLHVEQSMRQAGVELAEDNKQPADYLPTELQFLSHLCAEAARELDGGQGLTEAASRLVDFKRQHLDRWVPAFLDKLAAETKLEEYRAISQLCAVGFSALSKAVQEEG